MRETTESVCDVLDGLRDARGMNERIRILRSLDGQTLDLVREALRLATDGFVTSNVNVVPRVDDRRPLESETERWSMFFRAVESTSTRALTGNAARSAVHDALSAATEREDAWMRLILVQRMGLGVSRQTLNRAFPGEVRKFDVQKGHRFDASRLTTGTIHVEPKLDGVRCVAVVSGGRCEMIARSGKSITAFDDTIGRTMSMLPDGAYDGEIMGRGFQQLMTQIRRKRNPNVADSTFNVFDLVSTEEWTSGEMSEPFSSRRRRLEAVLSSVDPSTSHVRIVPSTTISGSDRAAAVSEIGRLHDEFVSHGFEGAMVKDASSPYVLGRTHAVMKLKSTLDADCRVVGVTEGEGALRGTLGSITIDFDGVEVSVGSGFTLDERNDVWSDRESYVGIIAEVRYQERTNDGSMRFPVFVRWRLDRSR